VSHIEIIAEIGINHGGDIELAKEMIQTAAECGADVAKFQLYDPITEYPNGAKIFSASDWDYIQRSKLTRRMLFEIASECERYDIEFMSSVSDLERIQWLEDVKVKRYKIASDRVFDKEVCKKILSLDKPVIVSDGYAYGAGKDMPDYLKTVQCSWLYCVSRYPASLEEINFFRLKLSAHSGFSDHTIGITAAVVAMSLGARIIEKHFTLDRDADGPDHICSAEPDELQQLCRMRDEIEVILYE